MAYASVEVKKMLFFPYHCWMLIKRQWAMVTWAMLVVFVPEMIPVERHAMQSEHQCQIYLIQRSQAMSYV
jgi:hypothetical protein